MASKNIIIDLAYGAIPAPFFIINGLPAPDYLMETIPATAFIVASVLFVGALAIAGEVMVAVLGLEGVSAWVLRSGLAIPVSVHWLIFTSHAWPRSSEKFFDAAGQIGFTAMSLLIISGPLARKEEVHPRQLIATICCWLWSARLGVFLFLRFLERRGDFRFVRARHRAGYHFFAWTMQGAWCWLQGFPLLLLGSVRTQPGIGLLDFFGVVVWGAGLLIETVADSQKACHRRLLY